MDVVKVSAVLGFAEATRPWLDLRTVFRWAQSNEAAEIQGQAVTFLDEAKRQRVNIQVRALSVEQEGNAGTDAGMDGVVAKFQTFPDTSLLGPLATVRFDMAQIEPIELPFHELNARIKESFYAPTPLTAAATDVQIVLDEAIDEETDELIISSAQWLRLNSTLKSWPFVAMGYRSSSSL